MMTNVVVAPSLGGLLVGGMVWEGVGVDAVDRKHTSCHFMYIATKAPKEIRISLDLRYHEKQTRCNHDGYLTQSYTAWKC